MGVSGGVVGVNRGEGRFEGVGVSRWDGWVEEDWS